MKRGRVYYAKLARGKAMFVAPRMIPYFHAVWGVRRADEPRLLSRRAQSDPARAPARMGDGDLRSSRRVRNQGSPAFTAALDELQAAMLVVPSDVCYEPKFTYLWTLAVGRFPDALRRRCAATLRCGRSRAAFSPAPA